MILSKKELSTQLVKNKRVDKELLDD